MSQRNSLRRSLAALFDTIRNSASGLAARATVLLTLGVAALLEALGASATYSLAFSVAGLLLIGVAAVARSSQQPRKLLVEYRRVRVRPLRQR